MGKPGLGWILICIVPPLPSSAWADEKLAEMIKQVGKMVEHPKSKSTQTQVRQDMPNPVDAQKYYVCSRSITFEKSILLPFKWRKTSTSFPTVRTKVYLKVPLPQK